MKVLLLIAALFSLNVHAGVKTSLQEASELTQKQLRKYLVANEYMEANDALEGVLDEDSVEAIKLKCENGEVYDYLKVYSGDTEHGPLFKENTMRLVGENGDGDFFLYGRAHERRDYLNCSEI